MKNATLFPSKPQSKHALGDILKNSVQKETRHISHSAKTEASTGLKNIYVKARKPQVAMISTSKITGFVIRGFILFRVQKFDLDIYLSLEEG